MVGTAVRRKRVFLFFLAVALAGGMLMIFGGKQSRASEFGAALLLGCFISASFFLLYFAKKRPRLVPLPLQFDADEPFVPHLVVDLTLSDERSDGAKESKSERRSIFVIGDQGFSARFIVPPEPVRGPGVPLRVEAQFIRPEVALPLFAAGSAFRVLQGRQIVGTGEVVSVTDILPGPEPTTSA